MVCIVRESKEGNPSVTAVNHSFLGEGRLPILLKLDDQNSNPFLMLICQMLTCPILLLGHSDFYISSNALFPYITHFSISFMTEFWIWVCYRLLFMFFELLTASNAFENDGE